MSYRFTSFLTSYLILSNNVGLINKIVNTIFFLPKSIRRHFKEQSLFKGWSNEASIWLVEREDVRMEKMEKEGGGRRRKKFPSLCYHHHHHPFSFTISFPLCT
jgi:hypothetical protein